MTLDPNRTVNVAVQVLPLADDPYPIVERAIAVTPRPSIEFSWEGGGVIQSSGVRHEVDAMETVTPRPSACHSQEGRGTVEGPLDHLLEIARQAHRACMEAGAEQTVTVIKIGDRRTGTTIAEKVDKFRTAR